MSGSHDGGHLCEQGSHCSHSCSTHRGVRGTALGGACTLQESQAQCARIWVAGEIGALAAADFRSWAKQP